MASVNNLGSLPSKMCYPQVEELGWRIDQLAGPTIELGKAPENAYLKLTREQAFFVFWRVKEWEITWQFDSANKSRTFIYTFPPDFEGNIEVITYEYVYSYPSKNTVITAPAQVGNFNFESQIPLSSEKDLVCQNIINPITGYNGFGLDSTALNVQATETVTTSIDVNFAYGSVNFIDNFIDINSTTNFFNLEQYLQIDTGIKNNLYYIPFIIDFNVALPTIGLLFDEGYFIEPDDPNWTVANPLPPIGGFLTSVPRFGSPSGTLSSYKTFFYLTPEFNEPIEFDMYDITTPSPASGTKFNLEGFTGITIRPKTYWEYDPNDGDGPIYDSATGEQLRSFP